MTDNSKKYELLEDMAKLVKKYGASTFSELSDEMSSPEFQRRFVNLISNIGEATKNLKIKKGNRKNPLEIIDNKIKTVKENDERRGEILEKIFRDLINKKILPTFRDVKIFIEDNDLGIFNSKSRQAILSPLMKKLILLDTAELSKLIRNIPENQEDSNRSLSGWSNIILNERRKPLADKDRGE